MAYTHINLPLEFIFAVQEQPTFIGESNSRTKYQHQACHAHTLASPARLNGSKYRNTFHAIR